MSPRRISEEPADTNLVGDRPTIAPANGQTPSNGDESAVVQTPPPAPAVAPPPQVQQSQQNQRPARRNMIDMAQLDAETLSDLRERARDMTVSGYSRLKKDDLIIRLLQ